jgi:hypothetical protein
MLLGFVGLGSVVETAYCLHYDIALATRYSVWGLMLTPQNSLTA